MRRELRSLQREVVCMQLHHFAAYPHHMGYAAYGVLVVIIFHLT